MIVPGRVAVKLAGRGAGVKVVVTKVIDEVYAEVVDIHGKKHKVNKRHLAPLKKIIDVEGLSDEEIAKKLEEA